MLEQDSIVGGIARTVQYRGYRFDIGGHRFFSKVKLINAWWENILGDDFQVRPRLSRIYYQGRFFRLPVAADECASGAWAGRDGAHRGKLCSGPNFPDPKKKASRIGCAIGLVVACSRYSSRPTPKKCGV